VVNIKGVAIMATFNFAKKSVSLAASLAASIVLTGCIGGGGGFGGIRTQSSGTLEAAPEFQKALNGQNSGGAHCDLRSSQDELVLKAASEAGSHLGYLYCANPEEGVPYGYQVGAKLSDAAAKRLAELLYEAHFVYGGNAAYRIVYPIAVGEGEILSDEGHKAAVKAINVLATRLSKSLGRNSQGFWKLGVPSFHYNVVTVEPGSPHYSEDGCRVPAGIMAISVEKNQKRAIYVR
jgi:hypothetical protein